MSAIILWIDREHAKAFTLTEGRTEKVELKATRVDHHTHGKDNIEHQRQEHKLFASTADRLNEATDILIVGPGITKFHFLNFLREEHPAIGRKIRGCETVDHPTDREISALARKFFAPNGKKPADLKLSAAKG